MPEERIEVSQFPGGYNLNHGQSSSERKNNSFMVEGIDESEIPLEHDPQRSSVLFMQEHQEQPVADRINRNEQGPGVYMASQSQPQIHIIDFRNKENGANEVLAQAEENQFIQEMIDKINSV